MSEYQYYEFQAVDRPLTRQQMDELRALSSRATITPTRFVNVYNWGNFRGDPATLMETHFDAFVYVANWGTRQFMLRLPRRLLDPATASLYCPEEWAQVRATGGAVILEFRSEDEEGDTLDELDDEDGDALDEMDDGTGRLSSLLPLRAEIASGDLRCLYLGWLLCAQNEVLDDDAVEPPLPPGLGNLSASLTAFADFLRIDGDLIAVAAERSAEPDEAQPSRDALEQWIRDLPVAEKDGFLLRLAHGGDPHLGAELLQRFRRAHTDPPGKEPDVAAGGRTVGELIAEAQRRAERRRREVAERAARERAARAREEAAARTTYLDNLTQREADAWRRVETLIETKRPAEYDQAVQLLRDLRDVAARSGQTTTFDARVRDLRDRHARKPSLIQRFDRSGLGT